MESKYIINEYSPSDNQILRMKMEEAAKKKSALIDAYMQLHIRPKPTWMPYHIWRFLLKELLELRYFKFK